MPFWTALSRAAMPAVDGSGAKYPRFQRQDILGACDVHVIGLGLIAAYGLLYRQGGPFLEELQ